MGGKTYIKDYRFEIMDDIHLFFLHSLNPFASVKMLDQFNRYNIVMVLSWDTHVGQKGDKCVAWMKEVPNIDGTWTHNHWI